ncbi:hypothetical protein Micbo1qcDRAFT_210256 [Microdochium bolleyi]|uniref:Uncharacterized protein n=1 Tax=Microdochium bolleyi TaxID=196109 RepID=A0A136IJX4_9PEZI|nr:hypothetical protein Micbo1qcDRAFT_210256 [Microdochium bolleyi]
MKYTIIEASCRSPDGNPFGAAFEGWLHLKGHLSAAKLSYERGSRDLYKALVENNLGQIIRDVRLDRPPASASDKGSSKNGDNDSNTAQPSSHAALVQDVHLLKLCDVQSSSVYLVLRETEETELPIRWQNAQIDTYNRSEGPQILESGLG